MRDTSWSEIANTFTLLAVVYRRDGKTSLPAPSAIASPQDEAECDRWCRLQAEDLRFPLRPPAHIQPWMLARAISVAALATQLAAQNETSPGPLTPKIVEHLLIHEWHGAMKARWSLLRRQAT